MGSYGPDARFAPSSRRIAQAASALELARRSGLRMLQIDVPRLLDRAAHVCKHRQACRTALNRTSQPSLSASEVSPNNALWRS